MSDLQQMDSSEMEKQLQMKKKMAEGEDEDVLKFMDSLDDYLTLINSLSSTLRQGWFDIASARYSMGASRVNSALLDLKEHDAPTYLEVQKGEEPHFTLCKWSSFSAEDSSKTKDADDELQQKSNSIRQRNKDASKEPEVEEKSSPIGVSSVTAGARVQKERSKSLAVFGTLVSPKLRGAQLSFETALETLVEIANARASMLSGFDRVRKHDAGSKD